MTIAHIKVFFHGKDFLKKIIVSDNLSSQIEQTFITYPNTTLIVSDLLDTFQFPSSIVVWGKDFSNQNSNKFRLVQLFNHSSCRFDYDVERNSLIFTNASLVNLGVSSSLTIPPEQETHVATIIITF
jgi:hypothetical protein